MRINRLLWGLWGAMIVSMLLRQRADTYMIVALIILPVLIVLLDLHEEISLLKEENNHQRKFVMDRYNLMQEKFNDVTSQIEKRLVVDFAEFAKSNPGEERAPRNRTEMPRLNRKKKKKIRSAVQTPVDFQDMKNETMANVPPENKPEEDFDDI